MVFEVNMKPDLPYNNKCIRYDSFCKQKKKSARDKA